MKKIKFFLISSILMFAFASCFFTSCEVGLGSAVDTAAPNVFFDEDTIGSGAVIRDSFMIH